MEPESPFSSSTSRLRHTYPASKLAQETPEDSGKKRLARRTADHTEDLQRSRDSMSRWHETVCICTRHAVLCRGIRRSSLTAVEHPELFATRPCPAGFPSAGLCLCLCATWTAAVIKADPPSRSLPEVICICSWIVLRLMASAGPGLIIGLFLSPVSWLNIEGLEELCAGCQRLLGHNITRMLAINCARAGHTAGTSALDSPMAELQYAAPSGD